MVKKTQYLELANASLFDFVQVHCLSEEAGTSHNIAVHRLCSLMRKMNVQGAVVETLTVDHPVVCEECEAINRRLRHDVDKKLYRITFLAKQLSNLNDLQSFNDDEFLAVAYIINFEKPHFGWISYLFQAVVTVPSMSRGVGPRLPLLNNYLHAFRPYQGEVILSDNERAQFNVSGTYFFQQNGMTSVCAHASLCMVLNNMNISAEAITPEDINKIIGVDHDTNTVGAEGNKLFTDAEIEQVLDRYGLTFELLDFFESPNIDYDDYLYKYVESKCPSLLVFRTGYTTPSHVVPILGHTLNTDMWRPEAEKLYSPPAPSRIDVKKSTSAWVDHFIIHDDNFGMYLCLPVDSLKRVTLPKHDPTFRAQYAVVIKPSEVKTPPREAENASVIILLELLNFMVKSGFPLDVWSHRVSNRVMGGRQLAVRTLLVSREEYAKSMENKDFEGNVFSNSEKEELVKCLPDRFWLTEITLPELYTANKTKIVDFCYVSGEKADKDKLSERWIQIRFPFVLLRNRPAAFVPMSVGSHLPLLVRDREHDVLEW
jgi:hypothetical protein